MSLVVYRLTVRLLVSGTGSRTAKLLGLGLSRVGNQQSSVVRNECLLKLVLALLINKLLVVSNESLGNSLTDSIDLGSVSSSSHSDSNVDVSEFVKSNNQQGLVNLESKSLGLDKGDGLTVDLDKSLTGLDVGNGRGGLLLAKSLNTSLRHYVICVWVKFVRSLQLCRV